MGSKVKTLALQFVKFAGVGILSFLIDYSLLIVFTEIFEFHYLASTTMSYTASIIFNYLVSMRFVFTHRTDISRSREFIIFVVLSAIGLILNNIGMAIGVGLIHIDYRLTKLLATMCVTIFNFVTRRMFLDGKAHENRQLKKAAAAGKYIYVNAVAAEHKLVESAAAAEHKFVEYAHAHGFAENYEGWVGASAQRMAEREAVAARVKAEEEEAKRLREMELLVPEPAVEEPVLAPLEQEDDPRVFSYDIDYDSSSDYSFGKAKRPEGMEERYYFDY